MKIFIAGGAGFIGSHVMDALLESNHQVMVFDNFSSGRRENLTQHNYLDIVEGSIANRNDVFKAFSDFNPDVVIHAAYEPVGKDNEISEVFTNIYGALNLIDAARKYDIKRFIYFQTVLIYGAISGSNPLYTDHPVSPICSYAISKLAAEYYIRSSGLDFISFRLANHYGPRNLTGAFPIFYKKLKAGERCQISDERRTFVFISDLVALVIKACDYKRYPGGIYHVSTDVDYSIKEIFLRIYRAVNGRDYDDSRNEHEFVTASEKAMKIMRLDWSDTKKTFDWMPTVALSHGIQDTVKWYERNEIKKTYTHFQK